MICDIINMAHHLGITVLAEGVETKVQRDMLKEAGCEIVQGYYYSKPIPIEEYEKLLHKRSDTEDRQRAVV
jgi:EAL domain-containing protein (putative c-di-GMP-specific phosphodiesterase class I)